MRGYINSAEQLATVRRNLRIVHNERLDAATFTSADYGRTVVYVDGRKGVLRQRFLHYPDNGTAVFQPDKGEALHCTPDEVIFV